MDQGIQNAINDVEQYCATHDRVWNVSRDVATLLYLLVKTAKPKHILEIGTSVGYSTLWLGAAAQDIGARVTTIDADPEKVRLAEKHIAQAGLTPVITVLEGEANAVVQQWNQPIDFLFLDAGKDDYFFQLKTLLPNLSAGAVVTADNVISHASAMEDFLEFMRTSPLFVSVIIPMGNGLLMAVKQ